MSHSWCTDDDEDDIISLGRVSNSANTRRGGRIARKEGAGRKRISTTKNHLALDLTTKKRRFLEWKMENSTRIRY